MTKKDIVEKLADDLDVKGSLVMKVVNGVMSAISEELSAGRSVELRNFGVFEVQVRKARKGRNPHKPEVEVVIPECARVKFRAGRILKEKVEKLIN